MAPGRSDFVMMSYNILAKSLGSNCIPWVMSVAPSFQEAVERATGRPWLEWKSAEVAPVYRKHWHKNFASGDYPAMRVFWSTRSLQRQEDIPACLTGIRFAGPDQVEYRDTKSGEAVKASTLRGLLRSLLPDGGLGESLFEHIVEEEEQVYSWPARGPRLFQEIVRPRRLAADGGEAADAAPDVAVLQEFDALRSRADYRGTGVEETFAEAMRAEGYASLLFKDPAVDDSEPSGIGFFWRPEVFELAGECEPVPEEVLVGSEVNGCIFNVDLMEHWHQHRDSPKGRGTRELMRATDRRNAGMAHLRHRASGKTLWVVCCHLMTTSRDSARTNEFPGEVRAAELQVIREEVRRRVRLGEAVILAGDFNTDARDMSIFEGRLLGASCGERLEIPTGMMAAEGGGSRWLDWHAGEAPMKLREAFEFMHRWGAAVGPEGHCTSTNAMRTDWIDYLWHCDRVRPVAFSDLRTPSRAIPDRDHGSDHLPLAVGFRLE